MKQDMIQDMTQSIINDMNIEIVRKMISVAKLSCGSTAKFAVRLMLLLAIVGGSATTAWADGVKVHGNVYGGGNLANVGGSVTVNIKAGQIGDAQIDNEHGNVYGGGALADTNTDNWNSTTETLSGPYHAVSGLTVGTSSVEGLYYQETESGQITYKAATGTAQSGIAYYRKVETVVNLTAGEVKGDVYGGGLGRVASTGVTAKEAVVYGNVTVNIGATDGDEDNPTYSGSTTIGGSVFGCNNLNGTPKGDVVVNVYQTAHTEAVNDYPSSVTTLEALETAVANPEAATYLDKFAIAAVYGGGNKAAYDPVEVSSGNPHSTTVHVYGCSNNTIHTVYGGGNAADATHVNVIIDGGFFDRIFGGGNGYSETGNHTNVSEANYNPGANISGSATTKIHGGLFRQVFGGSNQYGNVASASLTFDTTSGCTELISESFGGGNEAVINGNVETTLACSDIQIGSFYGGSNLANINGNVTLNVFGGTYTNVFGGSKGRVADTANGITAKSADISGTVTLNLYGGTITNAFGGSNLNGNIGGVITVNMLDLGGTCALSVHNIYGASNLATYTPDDISSGAKPISPIVNLIHGNVSKKAVTIDGNTTYTGGDVFGGGKGTSATVMANPTVRIGYDETTMSSYLPTSLPTGYSLPASYATSVAGNVYGGGDAAPVTGNTVVTYNESNISSTVDKLFGGGNAAGVSGTSTVTLTAGKVSSGVYGGCNSEGDVGGDINVYINGGTVGISNTARANVHGGGYGSQTTTGNSVNVFIGNSSGTPTIYGDVYGGSGFGNVNNAATDQTTVTLTNGTIYGNIYGGGLGQVGVTAVADDPNTTEDETVVGVDDYPALVNGAVVVNVNGGTVTDVFGCNNQNGSPQNTVTVNIDSDVSGSVYGGGNQAAYNPTTPPELTEPTTNLAVNINTGTISGSVFGGGLSAGVTGTTKVTVSDGTITSGVYGGCNTSGTINGTATVNLIGGTVGTSGTIGDLVFGGGQGHGTTTTNAIVNVGSDTSTGDARIYSNVYGGSALGEVGTAIVNLNHVNTLTGHVFGGGMGSGTGNDTQATVSTSATVNQNGISLASGKNIYGGCNENGIVNGSAIVHLIGGSVYNVFGAGKGQNTFFGTDGSVLVNVGSDTNTGSTIISGDIYGGSEKGTAGATIVNMNKAGSFGGRVFGGGKGDLAALATSTDTDHDDITAETNGGATVNLNSYFANLAGLYGGADINGRVTGAIAVNVNANVGALGNTLDIFGGGYGENTNTNGNVTVTIGNKGGTITPVIYGDIYGGSALGKVNVAPTDTKTDITKVDFLNGTLHGNIYGGGLGQKNGVNGATADVEAKVYGKIYVNIGASDQSVDNCHIDLTDNVSIYGCNNINGSPQDDVFVNIYKTAHTESNAVPATPTTGGWTAAALESNSATQQYALKAVYGGGNQAAYKPATTGKSSTVHVYTCDNTIQYVYGGGDAADVGTSSVNTNTNVIIDGGRFHNVFGGGNGAGTSNPGANIYGTASTYLYAGLIDKVFGGSNEKGDINTANLVIGHDEEITCEMFYGEVFGGGNLATINGNLVTTIQCGAGNLGDFYGGANAANINGSVTLNVYGGTFDNVFGGSKGVSGTPANIRDDVTLNLFGGTMENAFGGSDVSGGIGGKITVNMLDMGATNCGLTVHNIYGGGRDAAYRPTTAGNYPEVNIIRGTVSKKAVTSGSSTTYTGGNVFGGGLGTDATVTSNPTVNIGYNAVTAAKVNAITLIDGYTLPENATSCSTIIEGDVYGGGDAAAVEGNTTIAYNDANTSSTVANLFGGGNAAGVSGTSTVTLTSGTVTTGVYGGCNTTGTIGGAVAVNINGGTIGTDATHTADVFGGGYGETTETGAGVTVTIGTGSSNPIIWGDVYGGSALGTVNDDVSEITKVWLKSGTINGSLYGGGLGSSTVNALVKGEVQVVVDGGSVKTTNNTTRTTGAVFGCNNIAGAPQGTVTVSVNDSSTDGIGSVFGGGNQASYTGNPVVTISGGTVGNVYGGGNEAGIDGNTSVSMTAGNVLTAMYGGCNTSGTVGGTSTVTVTGGTLGTASTPASMDAIRQVLFGGGKGSGTSITGKVTLNVGTKSDATPAVYAGNASIYGNVYGGSENGEIHAVDVNLYGNTIYGNVFGGGYQTADGKTAATTVNVNLDGTKFDRNSDYTAQIFGCNNKVGTPEGNVTVHVYKTVAANPGDTYHVAAVYGGGNEADYEPITSDATKSTEVIIEGCDVTSIEDVYGGGNAAAVPATEVWILGSKIINNVYGGGNGVLGADHAAHVGFHRTSTTKSDYTTGSGETNVKLVAGKINNVYGGSNSNGDIRVKANVTMPKLTDYTATHDAPATSGCCNDLTAQNVYGGGNAANMEGDVNIILECMPNDYVDAVYGGAANAIINGNVSLTVTSGKFGRVFGGNNEGGSINGTIKVWVKEEGCEPLEIGELYGGGNRAPYSKYGCERAGSSWSANTSGTDYTIPKGGTVPAKYAIEVLVESCTSIGKIFGGGNLAEVIGDTHVEINMFRGMTEDAPTTLRPIGKIGEVFGGGNEAKVTGKTTVDIGTDGETTEDDGSVLEEHKKGVNITSSDNDFKYINPDYDPDDVVNKPLRHDITAGIYGGGNQAEVDGDTELNIGTADQSLGINIAGNIYGGGKEGNVTGDTQVNIAAKKNSGGTYTAVTFAAGNPGVTINGNVYGGGKGIADSFTCEKAMVGLDGQGIGNTNVIIANGTVTGDVYGGGEVGRVEGSTDVKIGLGDGTSSYPLSAPVIQGSVFGAGSGVVTHGYSALVRVNSSVTVEGNAQVKESVYGGGEMASVGRYYIATAENAAEHGVEAGEPYDLMSGGTCTVTIQGKAVIGPDILTMPAFSGNVFGAGKGILPYEGLDNIIECKTHPGQHHPGRIKNDGNWECYDGNESGYFTYIRTFALNEKTEVTIDQDAFVKGSVYGGSENGKVRSDTWVKIKDGQIGCGKGETTPYADDAFIDPTDPTIDAVTPGNALKTCDAWDYVDNGSPYDKFAKTDGTYDYTGYTFVPTTDQLKSSEGGRPVGTDGHTFYGNVFGGGSGYFPYAPGKWLSSAGAVGGDTKVEIEGGHILSNVYGGNEQTNVGTYDNGTYKEKGLCTITMTGGTVGVPRTKEQIEGHPVIGNLFGAGKGDKRVLFNTWTNVGTTSVNISGTAKIYGSVFGGGEDGHVINNAVTKIGGTVTTGIGNNTKEHTYSNVVIGSTGISGADGNVFGGGRGSETALTAGVVGGNVDLTIYNGNILGSVYGGGRLASVGTNFANVYLSDGVTPNPLYGLMQDGDAHGHVDVKINGGFIGTSTSTGINGNIFGGSKGVANKFNLGIVKSTKITMTDGTAYASVYGGGELAQVVESHTTDGKALGTEINISGGTIGIEDKGGATWGNVFAGGKGNTSNVEAGLVKTNTKVAISQASGKTTKIWHNIYGGGAYGSVGEFTYANADAPSMPVSCADGTGTAYITITGGTIGKDGDENGMIFGSSRGDVGAIGEIHDYLAWVNDTYVTIGETGGNKTTPLIKGSVYGSGENGHAYHDTDVKVHSGTIGVTENDALGGASYKYRGNVYGGGCGTDKYWADRTKETHKGDGDTYNALAGVVYGETNVTIDGGLVVHNVYGAGAMGSVGATDNTGAITSGGKTTIAISGGTVGFDGNDNGNVFGAARGDATSIQTGLAQVLTTDVAISGDAEIKGNVYGGGEIGCVGTFAETAGRYVWSSGGLSKVTVSGGKIGPDNNVNPEIGNVFGAGKGKANTFKCEKAMVRETVVSISDGTVNGNVYGGGEIGRVEEDTEVTIGRKSGEAEGAGTGKPIINGSVFGAGKGKETHGYSALVRGNTTVTVEGGTGAIVGNSVYGGGEIASVGRYGLDNKKMPEILVDGGYCYVKVLGNVVIGSTNASDDKGNVFGAGKGVTPHFNDKDDADRSKRPRRMTMYNATDFPVGAMLSAAGTATGTTPSGSTWEYYDESAGLVWEYFRDEDAYDTYLQTLALATHPEVTIGGNTTVNSSVFGGGELGLTKGSVIVNIIGGTVVKDVYGGGSLANTNTTSTWAERGTDGKPLPPDEHGNYTVDEEPVHPTTTVNLSGGKLRDAYGGGLGRLASTGVSAVEAFVYGNVTVNLNEGKGDADKGCIVNRVFGCNNLNGSPKGKVRVNVFATQRNGGTNLADKAVKGTNTYDVAAVYGGGNLSPYVPTDPETTEERAEVYIDGCGLTSIKQVYGGGNAASVPATYVVVNRVYEIDEVFGGGNGYDNYSLKEGSNTVWYQNPGANVGYYNYTTYPKTVGNGSGTEADPYKEVVDANATTKELRLANAAIQYGTGIAKTEIRGGTVHTVYGGSNSKGNVRKKLSSAYSSMHDDCPMVIDQTYGSGKNAISDGEVEVISDCAKGINEMFGGAKDADVDGDINLYITNGSSLTRVFGGNNTSGAVNGSITVTVKEGGCEPIRIGELYAGGFLAPYSVYGYKKTNGVYDTEEVEYIDENNVKQKKLQRIPLNKGDEGALEKPHADPRIQVISATRIDNIYGGGYQAKLVGNPHVNVNMEPGRILAKYVEEGFVGEHKDAKGNVLWTGDHIVTEEGDDKGDGILAIGSIGSVYGGGNMADIVGDTYVEIGTGTWHNADGVLETEDAEGKTWTYNESTKKWTRQDKTTSDEAPAPARNAATITGDVFGGGKGVADNFFCAKAMVGVDGDGVAHPDGGTNITIGNGTVNGSVYGGGEIGRVEKNTTVTIGLETGIGTPVIEGKVFGAGKGEKTHGYAALVRGNTYVTIQGDAKVKQSVYGGGEIASVGRYNVADAAYNAAHPEVEVGMPYSLASENSGNCYVTVRGNAEIGPDTPMQMKADGSPDDLGHVFGAGKGVLPYEGYEDGSTPWRMPPSNVKEEYGDGKLDAYLAYIETLALATQAEVTIGGNAFVKGSVYGGSENGHVQHDTHVTISGGQIGAGEGVVDENGKPRRYTTDEWKSASLAECAHWDYDPNDAAPWDPYAIYENGGKYYYDAAHTQYAEGGAKVGKDGHTFYGNVFGGGSGLIPYAPGKWHRAAGSVGGNTVVDITGGHILTSVYGGNEQTDVGTYMKDSKGALVIPVSNGKCTINMTGGTVGVPRTEADMKAHPLTCYVFGAGKGDPRIFFNTWTNVINTEVNISGDARIYGSTFGGGEDGHVINNAVTNISGDVIIGTTGTSYVDGNVFGGGRGFTGDAQTAGTVGGNVEVNISDGTMLGSVYGGGRLASVGTQFTAPDDVNYGNFIEDADGKTYGHVTVNINGGTIGRDFVRDAAGKLPAGAEHSGNVFGGSMGRLTLLNGTMNPIWPKMAQVKTTAVNVYGDAVVKRTVFGGGELGTVRDNACVTIGGHLQVNGKDSTVVKDAGSTATVGRDVYGGGYGSDDFTTMTTITVKEKAEGATTYSDVDYKFTPMIFAGCVGQNTYVNIIGGQVKKSVYGGGEMASVGIMDCRVDANGDYVNVHEHKDENNGFILSWPYHFENVPGYFGATHVKITGGRIGLNSEENKEANNPFEDLDNGDVCGGGKGIAGDYNNYVFCANVGSTEVTIDYPTSNTATPQNYMDRDDIECIAGAVYGGAENGHVMGDTKLTLKNGLVGHSIYGGGSGKGQFETKLLKIGKTKETATDADYYTREIYSITAGKVFGNTEVIMEDGYVVRNVYGGGNMGSVGKGNYAGGPDDYSTAGYGEKITGDNNLWTNDNPYSQAFLSSGKSTVKILGGTVGYIDSSNPSNSMYPWNSSASLPYGNVFGGCRGESAPNIRETPRYLYSPEFFVGYVNETDVTIGAENSTTGPTIIGSVFGGGMDGHVRRDTHVEILSGEIGLPYNEDNQKVLGTDPNNIQWLTRGNVYGAGSGIGKYKYDFDYDGKYTSTVTYAGKQTKEEDYSTSAGSVTRFTTVNIKGGRIHRNVYGGGSLSSVGAPKIGQSYDLYHPEHSTAVGKQALNTVILSGGQVGDDSSFDANGNYVYGGRVFGGSRGDTELGTSYATANHTKMTVEEGAHVIGSVFGGGEAGIVKDSVVVTMNGGAVDHDLYGGGALANTNTSNWDATNNTWAAGKYDAPHTTYKTDVILKGGTIGRNVYGGGLGKQPVGTEGQAGYEPGVAAKVYGDVLVKLNETIASDNCVVKGSIFGCNNFNGSPQSGVTVHIYKTQGYEGHMRTAADKLTNEDDADHTYELAAVYGGGNQAAFSPDLKATCDTVQAHVIIDGCDLTSIKNVYGGGNAASTPATNVTVNSVYEIEELFGGGNGYGEGNPGANVGYTPYPTSYDPPASSTEERAQFGYGSGVASVNIYGGRIHRVFGGSNTKGNVRQTAVTMLDNQDQCPLIIDEAYGGGKSAPMDAEAKLLMACIPGLKAVYGGAQNADIQNDVTLNITNGTFDRVFGGNNISGTIRGMITVNIEETGCKPLIIGQLYGGGNLAPYEAPAGKPGPTINVKSFTSIGDIYGGGYGNTAVVKGDTHVNINVVEGKWKDKVADQSDSDYGKSEYLYDETGYKGTTKVIAGNKVTIPSHAKGKIGAISNVFGGGNAAPVEGNTNVNIGTLDKVEMESLYEMEEVKVDGVVQYEEDGKTPKMQTKLDSNGKPIKVKATVVGADIRENVYGGGNAAKVTGKTNVEVGKKQ